MRKQSLFAGIGRELLGLVPDGNDPRYLLEGPESVGSWQAFRKLAAGHRLGRDRVDQDVRSETGTTTVTTQAAVRVFPLFLA